MLVEATGYDAGLSGDEQIRITLRSIVDQGGMATIKNIYEAVNDEMRTKDFKLSDQGKASLRFFVNKVAVQAGYIYPYDKNNPGWRATPEGKQFIDTSDQSAQLAFNIDTEKVEKVESNAARGAAFELYILKLLRNAYPFYSWYQQGIHKNNERGLDFIGNRIGDAGDESNSIGVQVKFHQANNAPTGKEWLKFLSGCFARRVDSAIFVTTGRLTSAKRREAQEARVVVIEGKEEITRIAKLHNVSRFELFDKHGNR